MTSAQTPTLQSSVNCFCTNPCSHGISYQARYSCSAKNRLRLNDVTLSILLSYWSYVISWHGFRFSTLPSLRILVLRLDIIDWQALKCLTICLFITPAVSIPITILCLPNITVLIVHRIVLFWEPDCCFQDGGQENRREVGTYFITISSVY